METQQSNFSDSEELDVPLNPVFLDWLLMRGTRDLRDLEELFTAIAIAIEQIDQSLVRLVRQVLSNERFRQLESSYRSIFRLITQGASEDFLIRKMPKSREVNVFVFDISAEELTSDLNANSYRQTWLYDKLFRKRFDYLIGEQNVDLENFTAIFPFSLMLVDFDFGLKDGSGSVNHQIGLESLRKLARVGEECFCMFLVNLSPNFFGDSIDSFRKLENIIDIEAILRQPRFDRWNEFRQQDYSRMIGLTMPRVLIRKPYRNYRMGHSVHADGTPSAATGIVFNEHDGFELPDKLLWGRSCFAVAQPIIRSFRLYDWFSDVTGIDRDPKQLASEDEVAESGYDCGVVDRLPATYFQTDSPGVVTYPPVEIIISETDEAVFSSLGFIPLFAVHQSWYAALLSCQSVQEVRVMTTEDVSNNLQLSSMFNYMLCVCRMAHRLRIECRGQIGKSVGPEEIQDHMQEWLMKHSSGQNRGHEQKMVKPFFDEGTGFFVHEDVTDPGKYDCTVRLCPHHKYDNGHTSVTFEPVTMQMQLNSSEGGE